MSMLSPGLPFSGCAGLEQVGLPHCPLPVRLTVSAWHLLTVVDQVLASVLRRLHSSTMLTPVCLACRRVGTIIAKEKHKGSFDIIIVKDAAGHTFATRMTNVFVIGRGDKPMVSLPKQKGLRLPILQEQAKMYGKATVAA